MEKGARGRARARARPPSMSLSQGFSSVGSRAVSHTVGAVGHPLNRSKVPGMTMVPLPSMLFKQFQVFACSS